MATIEGLSLSSPKLLLRRNMAYVSSTWPLPFLRMKLTVGSAVSQPKLFHCKNMQLHNTHWIVSASKKNAAKIEPDDISDGENVKSGSKKKKNKSPKLPSREKNSNEITEGMIPAEATTEITVDQGEKTIEPVGYFGPEIDPSMLNIVASILNPGDEGESEEEEDARPTRSHKRGATEKKTDLTRYKIPTREEEQEREEIANLEKTISDLFALNKETIERDAITQDYTWPPLVICFGHAKASFIPYARPANRILNRGIHEAMQEFYWSPDRFFRAPGGAVSSVAIALAGQNSRVEFMGKLGGDSLGKDLLYELNFSGVQTRCVKIDDSVSTAVSRMKLTVDGGGCLKTECVEPCAEDSFSSSDINFDILKEGKMLYFNSSALLDPSSKLPLMEAISIMKSQGGFVFFDLNLPLPLWHSSEETKSFLKESFDISNFIEMTQQELDFLCGIKENEKDASNFVHRSREEVKEVLLHDNLEVLFVTNGTSSISYYTRESDGIVTGTEDVPIEPSSCEMSVSGDAVVAALMSMLVSEPDMTTTPSFLETSIKHAIQSGVIAQMLVTEDSGFYSDEQSDDEQKITTHEDVEEEESYHERVGDLAL